MLIAKCHRRIGQYLGFLEKKRYEHVESLQVEAAETFEGGMTLQYASH